MLTIAYDFMVLWFTARTIVCFDDPVLMIVYLMCVCVSYNVLHCWTNLIAGPRCPALHVQHVMSTQKYTRTCSGPQGAEPEYTGDIGICHIIR
jgi:hypothetical protein